MARYLKDFPAVGDPQNIYYSIDQYLKNDGYDYITYEGENIYKKGEGYLTNPTFFKISFYNNFVRVETWMKYALLPGVFVGELGLDGFVGCLVKGPWKKRVADIENIINMINYQASQNPQQPVQPVQQVQTAPPAPPTQSGGINQGVKICNKCGAQMSETATFCTACGNQYQSAPNQATGYGINVGQQYQGAAYAQPPIGQNISRKDYIDNYADESVRKSIKSIAGVCYFCAAVTFVLALIFSPVGIIDAVILAGLAIGMHVSKSRVCAVLIFVFSIIETLLSLVFGSLPYMMLIAGVSAFITFNKIEKQYKAFLNGNNQI